MIATIRSRKNRALVTCDGCSAELSVVADTDTRGRLNEDRLNEGQINAKLTAKGWRVAGRKHFCPTCVARQREEKPIMKSEVAAPPRIEGKSMEALAPLRQPTREQKREIVAMLDMAYDTAAGRYRGADTDKTIAETIGPNIMPGWVAESMTDAEREANV